MKTVLVADGAAEEIMIIEEALVCRSIDELIRYALQAKLIAGEDGVYVRNRLLELLRLPSYQESDSLISKTDSLEELLRTFTCYAQNLGLIGGSAAEGERFETAVMGLLTPWPSTITELFWKKYRSSPKEATDYFYRLCQDTNYICRYRTRRNIGWQAKTEYGALDITINLAKPEKDPRDIAAARLARPSGYPACLLCAENVGCAGHGDRPARQNHRIIPIELEGEEWALQYSPYVYYNEHCIVLNQKHLPMVIGKGTFSKMVSFIKLFPHYFIGSNADLPIVGGSILSHEHFQGGRYSFPMERAPIEAQLVFKGFEDVVAGIVQWPMSVLRIAHADAARLAALAGQLLEAWQEYSDAEVGIRSHTGAVPHNTVTPIARMRDGRYEFDLVLRSNITSPEHPMGVFHPHAELHNIKKENIGLIEVMGLAVLPPRLRDEMELLGQMLSVGADIRSVPQLEKHGDWVDGWVGKYSPITPDHVGEYIRDEIGLAFRRVLEHAGVFKRNADGKAAFRRFLAVIG